MIKPYHDFKEVEAEIKAVAHPLVYKYRTWEQDFHKKIITERIAWFAHPHTLNDPYDVRPPYKFIADNINWDEYKAKLYRIGREVNPGMPEEQLAIEVEGRFAMAQADPVGNFHKNRGEYINDPAHYEQIGVFSCCTSGVNEPMWAHYGNNHNGFAIGFNTVALAEALNCTAGYVNYDDTPIDYYILGDNVAAIEKEIFQKSTRWTSEEEFRFITSTVGILRERASTFPPEAVTEILFGASTSKAVQDEIIAAAAITLPGVSFYQVIRQQDAYGFQKVKL